MYDTSTIENKIKHQLADDEANDECALDEDCENVDKLSELYEFVSLSSYVALTANNKTKLNNIVKANHLLYK